MPVVTTDRKYVKRSVHSDYGMQHYYRFYSKQKNLKKAHSKLTSTEFGKIIKIFMSKAVHEVCTNNLEVKLPCSLGYISVIKKKYKPGVVTGKTGKTIITKMPIDWKSTIEMWNEFPEAKKEKKLLYYRNKETQGYIMKWNWFQKTSQVKNLYCYKFRPSRDNKRKLAKAIKDEATDYFVKY